MIDGRRKKINIPAQAIDAAKIVTNFFRMPAGSRSSLSRLKSLSPAAHSDLPAEGMASESRKGLGVVSGT